MSNSVLAGWFGIVALLAPAADAVAQVPGEPAGIDDELLEQRITEACAAARAAGSLVAAKVLAAQLATAASCEGKPVAPRTQPLGGAELYAAVLPSVRIVGHFYQCKECDEWHFNGASGFCIDDHGSIATCAHVVAPDGTMRDAFLVVADLRGNVWPVEKVVAVGKAADLCVLQTAARGTVPLPMRTSVRTGEAVWCLSHPDHQFAFFSGGMVARQYVLREADVDRPEKPAAGAKVPKVDLKRPAQPWLHVTCDFCKGSSGGPIVDACGNLVGIAQSTVTVIYDEDTTPIDTQMVFKNATPAACLAALLQPAPK